MSKLHRSKKIMILKWLAQKRRSLPLSPKLFRPLVWLRGCLNGASLGVRLIVQDEFDRVLLVRHTYIKGWYLPGGAITPGEPPLEAAKRELFEETGVEAISQPDLFGYYLNSRGFMRDYVSCYRIADWKAPDKLGPSDDGEIAETGFYAFSDLPDDVSPSTRARVEELFGLRPLSDRW
ncbi:NUDIX domain-containing protein [Cohaesibacter gelatinilyticus]|uniref:ADP-ribose pyrophosphatase YjhB, NUDIX family n=1 Tax=Cohaesibacter gelatinilyticus TaxID=372072 RepID=A0A285PHK7_9HYPH|nr:ADP-ribose pyrophosphatase YjhB, NUDIX family [Cohaesibacter gelatinilyticus]